jgi:hypothetical protein
LINWSPRVAISVRRFSMPATSGEVGRPLGVSTGVVGVAEAGRCPGITSVPSGEGREPGSGTAGAPGGTCGAAAAGMGWNSMVMAAKVAAEYASGVHRRSARCPICRSVPICTPSAVPAPNQHVSPLRSYLTRCIAVD